MLIEVVGKEIEKIKGDFESVINGMNMVGEIQYYTYSELYDEGTKCIQKAYELGKSELEEENKALKEENEKLQLLLDVQNFLIEPKNKEKKEHLKQNGWVEIAMPCSKEDARDCLTKQEGLCESTDGLCRIKINLSRLCKC